MTIIELLSLLRFFFENSLLRNIIKLHDDREVTRQHPPAKHCESGAALKSIDTT